MTEHPFAERVAFYRRPADGGFCPYCGEWMSRQRRFPRPRSPTRDHIFPKSWGGPDVPENRRIVCYRCNLNRARAGHCLAALFCARAVARSTGATTECVLRQWNLPRARPQGLWLRVHRGGATWLGPTKRDKRDEQ